MGIFPSDCEGNYFLKEATIFFEYIAYYANHHACIVSLHPINDNYTVGVFVFDV